MAQLSKLEIALRAAANDVASEVEAGELTTAEAPKVLAERQKHVHEVLGL